MTSKGAKETIVSRLGFKSSSSPSKAESELEKVRKENSHLKRKIDELAKRGNKPPDSDKNKLLERIISLETLRERNNQQLLTKEHELEVLRQQLSAKGGEMVASLQAQLDQQRKEAEQKDVLFQSLSQETENLKNQLATVSTRCQSLETPGTNGQVSHADFALVQDQLKDALEKNQQWLVYDQQREAYVQSVLARLLELEKQPQANEQQTKTNSHASAIKAAPENDTQLKSQYDQMVLSVQKDLESQKDQVAKTQQELKVQREQTLISQAELQSQKEHVIGLQEEISVLQRRYEDKCSELSSFLRRYQEKSKDLEEAKMQLQAEQLGNRHAVSEERKVSNEQADRMRLELDNMEIRLEDERKRSAELLLQVNMLQKSLVSQNEERRRIAALEEQIQLSVKEFETERMDRRRIQHQLHKVLKELCKARDQNANLESANQCSTSSYNEFERLSIDDRTSPSKVTSFMDESFLDCPNCHASYPTSQHRQLLAHIDYCLA